MALWNLTIQIKIIKSNYRLKVTKKERAKNGTYKNKRTNTSPKQYGRLW